MRPKNQSHAPTIPHPDGSPFQHERQRQTDESRIGLTEIGRGSLRATGKFAGGFQTLVARTGIPSRAEFLRRRKALQEDINHQQDNALPTNGRNGDAEKTPGSIIRP